MPRSARGLPAAAAAGLLLLQLLAPAAGHGMMVQPRSRNWNAYLQTNFPWAHGLNAGGASLVSDKGRRLYPNGQRGYCGDAYNEVKWDVPGPVQTTYRTGQVINVDIAVAVNHMGRMSVQVCPLDAKPGQGKCKNLYLKAKGFKGVKSWYFPGIKDWTGGNWGGDGPRYGDGTFSAYRLPEIGDWSGWGCTSQRLCNQFKDMWVYRTKWMLPKDFTCDHCKLQWTWTTGHNCWPPCEKNNPMAQCKNIQVYPTCGTPGSQYPEEFVNCADVKIIDNGKIDFRTNFPPWESAVQAATKAGVWGNPRPSVMNVKDGDDSSSAPAASSPSSSVKDAVSGAFTGAVSGVNGAVQAASSAASGAAAAASGAANNAAAAASGAVASFASAFNGVTKG